MPAAVQADHDDYHGGAVGRVTVGVRRRYGGRIARAARNRDCWRPAGEPGPHALHDPGDLSRLRAFSCAAEGAQRRRIAGKCGRIMNLSETFIRNSVGTTLLTVAIALAGAVAFRFLPVSPLPQVDFPTIQVGASLPGASPQVMASAVAAPLERQFGHIAGLTEMTSTSGLGTTNVTLQFDLNRSIDAAARDVEAAINAARGQLPTNLPSNPTYRKVNPADAPILMLSLTSETVSI